MGASGSVGKYRFFTVVGKEIAKAMLKNLVQLRQEQKSRYGFPTPAFTYPIR
jgi:hypothetical protein